MTQTNHPTDDVLLELVNDEQCETHHDDVETHISNCGQCQTRLMSLVGHDWLEDYRDCLSAEFLSETSHPGLKGSPADKNEFETGAIEQMLKKVLAPPTHPETLGRLGRYEVENVVGIGGMGLVLRGYDRELQRPVAIKMMLPRLANNGTAKQRFSREARAVAAILHPNVIAIHGVDETATMPWFVMPFIAGPSLRELVDQSGPLPEREIVRIGLQIASGLAAAHGQGLVHRDIKPDNILVDNQINRVVITDFGLARRETEDAITQTGVLAGTLNYMSPEQTRGEDVDGRSDLFSLGALLYFLATGHAPFRANTHAGVIHNISSKRHPDIRTHNPEISKAMSGTIDSLLAKKPTHRFQSAVELEMFFERFVSHLNLPTQHRLPGLPRANTWKTKAVAASLLSVGILFAVIWGISHLANTPEPTAEALWQNIQTQYQLQNSPDEFLEEIKKLGNDFDRVDRALGEIDGYENAELKNETSKINSLIQKLDSGLEIPDSVSK